MAKIAFLGAGSAVFAKNILGDCLLSEALRDSHIALYDIDRRRLGDCKLMLDRLNANVNAGRAKITAHCGVRSRRAALRRANYVVNAIQVGAYDPGTIRDFEIPKKHGLRQTIADTLGIGGIFRALRTIPVLRDFAEDIHAVCPNAWFLNYTNPMAMDTMALLRLGVKAVGLCHSVQGCAGSLLKRLGMIEGVKKLQWRAAGINHQTWLTEINDGGRDLYPEIRKRAARRVARVRKLGVKEVMERADRKMKEDGSTIPESGVVGDLVRMELMRAVGYYVTESSEHTAEYVPWFIKRTRPELIEEFNIPLDEYLRRSVRLIERWRTQREQLIASEEITHKRTREYASEIMRAMETNEPFRFHGNVRNDGLVTNLPRRACVEVACMADRNGVTPTVFGDLPEACAAINRTNINVQLLAVEAALTGKRDHVYQAAMMDPHTGAELSLDEIRRLCDELIEAHAEYLPDYH